MKKLNLSVLLLGAALFTGLGAVSLSAEGMKCGAVMKQEKKKASEAEKCGAEKKDMEMGMKKGMKCGAAMKKEKKKTSKAGKCGKGKCGGK